MHRLFRAATAILAVLATVAGPSTAREERGSIAPEAATGTSDRNLATAARHMISAANPHAADAGREILRAGGSAADAAIAAQLVLGLVEPQSSGLGGGGFVLHHDGRTGKLSAYDGRETAPAAARPDRFLKGGQPIPYDTAVHSGLSVGVPGLPRLLETLHGRHGRLPWARLFEPAIRLAEEGFAVSPRLNLLLRWMGAKSFAPAARAYFFDAGGAPRATGERLNNPQYAATLHRLAAEGIGALHTGPIADAIVTAVADAPNAAGDLVHSDLADYTIVRREPHCASYRGYQICGMGPPSSGGLVVAQTLTMLEQFDLGHGPAASSSVTPAHLVAEAQKLAYADRDRYVADPAFVPVPAGLTDRAYLTARGTVIDPRRAMPPPEAGVPPGADRQSFGLDATQESIGTTHLSVIDGDGNAVALTSTIEAAFGSRLWAAGFLLNNELTDFSLRPTDRDGRPVANRVEGGKRPRSSMAPTIVYGPDGRLFAVLGSPGGARIPLYVLKTIIALIDWKLDAQAAAALANFGSRGGAIEIEASSAELRPVRAWAALGRALRLKALGHRIDWDLMTSGTHVLVRRGDLIEGGADPRREGQALGD